VVDQQREVSILSNIWPIFRTEEAVEILKRIRGIGHNIDPEIKEIQVKTKLTIKNGLGSIST
jgi:hypothetical protein